MTIKIKHNLGKKEIVSNIKSIIGLSSKNIQKITDEIIVVIIDILVAKKKVNLKNFGSFEIIYKKKREGRNPKTQEEFTISSRNSARFKASSLLKQKINQI